MTGAARSLVRRRVAFASPEISITLLFAGVNSWYFYYLVNICGLPGAFAGLAFALGRGADACVDPFLGRWIDRGAPVRGRKAPVGLALGPAAAAFVLIWTLPALAPGIVLKTLAAALAFCLFAFFYSMATVARMSMLPRYEPGQPGRIGQVGANMGLVFVSLMAAVAGLPALVAALDGAAELSGTAPGAWIAGAAVLASLAVLGFVPFLLWVPDQRGGDAGVPQGLRGAVRGVLCTPGSGPLLAAFVLSVLALGLVQSMLPFFLESVLGVPKAGQAPVLGLVFGAAILSLPVWVGFGRRVGKPRGYLAGLAVFGLFLGLAALLPRGGGVTPHLLAAAVCAGLAIAALNLFPWSMLPDLADACRLATGRAQEGFCVAIFMFANQLAGGCAVALNGLMLSLSGHTPGQAEQAAPAVFAIALGTIAAPALLATASTLAVFRLIRPG